MILYFKSKLRPAKTQRIALQQQRKHKIFMKKWRKMEREYAESHRTKMLLKVVHESFELRSLGSDECGLDLFN